MLSTDLPIETALKPSRSECTDAFPSDIAELRHQIADNCRSGGLVYGVGQKTRIQNITDQKTKPCTCANIQIEGCSRRYSFESRRRTMADFLGRKGYNESD